MPQLFERGSLPRKGRASISDIIRLAAERVDSVDSIPLSLRESDEGKVEILCLTAGKLRAILVTGC